MQLLVSFAEGCGALCIVISDMSVPGAPMVYVNPPFCRCTGYAREEAVGRNCRFLQGPDTEFESLRVIRSTLAKVCSCGESESSCDDDDDSRVSWLWSRRSRASIVVGRGKQEIAAQPPPTTAARRDTGPPARRAAERTDVDRNQTPTRRRTRTSRSPTTGRTARSFRTC